MFFKRKKEVSKKVFEIKDMLNSITLFLDAKSIAKLQCVSQDFKKQAEFSEIQLGEAKKLQESHTKKIKELCSEKSKLLETMSVRLSHIKHVLPRDIHLHQSLNEMDQDERNDLFGYLNCFINPYVEHCLSENLKNCFVSTFLGAESAACGSLITCLFQASLTTTGHVAAGCAGAFGGGYCLVSSLRLLCENVKDNTKFEEARYIIEDIQPLIMQIKNVEEKLLHLGVKEEKENSFDPNNMPYEAEYKRRLP